MGTERFPKGKKPGKREPGKAQETGDVYRRRQTITASPEVRSREVFDNDYGKKARPQPEREGMFVSPARTTLHGR